MALLFVACLPTLLVPVGLTAPGVIGYVIFLSVPLIAIAWLWIGVGWLRGTGSIPGAPRGLVLADATD